MRNHFEAKFILGALLAALSAAPAAFAQSQAQATAQNVFPGCSAGKISGAE